jgi:hypothetical protein
VVAYLFFRESIGTWWYAQDVAYEVVEVGTQSPFEDQKNFVIVNLEEWRDLWLYVHEDRAAPLPAIDFSRYVVLALFQGQRPSGGYALEVDAVRDVGGSLVVAVSDIEPGQGCTVTDDKTSPFTFIVTQKFSGSLATEVTRKVISCTL